MKQDDEIQGLRNRVETLEAENYQLRARLGRCTCGAAAEEVTTTWAAESTPNEDQGDLFARLGCLDCD